MAFCWGAKKLSGKPTYNSLYLESSTVERARNVYVCERERVVALPKGSSFSGKKDKDVVDVYTLKKTKMKVWDE